MVLLNKRAAFASLLVLMGAFMVFPALPLSGQTTAAQCDSLYGDLSAMEHCVRNYSLSIEREDIERYASIFRDDCEFVTMMGKLDLDIVGDISQEPTMRMRGLLDELELMKGMFGAASEIRFVFEPGTWSRVDSIAGKPCGDCWQTNRKTEYSLVFNAPPDGEAPPSVSGSNRIWMYVSPAGGKWKIFRVIEQEIDDAGE